jgi:hypothetical protein
MRPVQRKHGYPTRAQTARYDTTNSGASRTRPLARTCLKTAGAALGSIIAAIIATQRAIKNANEPISIFTPMSIPLICLTAMSHATTASPSVAVSAAAVAAGLALVTADASSLGTVLFVASPLIAPPSASMLTLILTD